MSAITKGIKFGLALTSESMVAAFVVGLSAGAGFELFKIHFTMRGFNYYKTFKRNQLTNELAKFEESLIQRDQALADYLSRSRQPAPA